MVVGDQIINKMMNTEKGNIWSNIYLIIIQYILIESQQNFIISWNNF